MRRAVWLAGIDRIRPDTSSRQIAFVESRANSGFSYNIHKGGDHPDTIFTDNDT
jgi:hypothetical protein